MAPVGTMIQWFNLCHWRIINTFYKMVSKSSAADLLYVEKGGLKIYQIETKVFLQVLKIN